MTLLDGEPISQPALDLATRLIAGLNAEPLERAGRWNDDPTPSAFLNRQPGKMRKPVVPDRAQQQPTAAGQVATEAVPSAFCVEPTGNFVFASGRLASYRINSATDALTRRPCGGSQVRS